jgi:hypothetical protein
MAMLLFPNNYQDAGEQHSNISDCQDRGDYRHEMPLLSVVGSWTLAARVASVRHNSSSDSCAANTVVQKVEDEHFVDATVAAAFLSITRKYLLKLSRLGLVPAHPLGVGSRRQWRYRISELAQWALAQNAARTDNTDGSPRAAKGRK